MSRYQTLCLGLILFLAFGGRLEAQVGTSAYCSAAPANLKYCADLYGELDPWLERQLGIYGGPKINGDYTPLLFATEADPASLEFMRPVGRLAVKFQNIYDPGDQWAAWCTASILDANHILTAGHCIRPRGSGVYRPVEAQVRLNYKRPGNKEVTHTFKVLGEKSGCAELSWSAQFLCPVGGNYDFSQNGLDYAILRIAKTNGKSASSIFGTLTFLEITKIPEKAAILVPQHADSQPLAYSKANIREVYSNYFDHLAHTYNMSSGSPVLDSYTGEFYGLHIRGNTDSCSQSISDSLNQRIMPGCSNRAVSVFALAKHSEVIRSAMRRQVRESALGTPSSERGVRSEADALNALMDAAQAGNSRAQLRLAKAYQSGSDGLTEDAKRSSFWVEKAAVSGNTFAQLKLAINHLKGYGVSKSETEYISWVRKAANAGNAQAQYLLGVAYMGQGSLGSSAVTRSNKQMVFWLHRAALQNFAEAQHSIGNLLAAGNVLKQSDEKAAYWYRRAINNGSSKASSALISLLGVQSAESSELFEVFFAWGEHDIDPSATPTLDNVVRTFRSSPAACVMLAGHIDSGEATSILERSSTEEIDKYAKGITRLRLSSVQSYLAARGIPNELTSANDFGDTRPRIQTDEGVSEPQNRRVTVTLASRCE